jgi:hypothetical protein
MNEHIQRHENPLLHFSVEILDKPFTTSEAIHLEKTARVFFYNHLGKRIETVDYGLMSSQQVYELIAAKKNINLNQCYIHNFSLSEYRKLHGLKERSPIHLLNFTADKAFFDCETIVDFSYAEFDGDQISFGGTIFGNGVVNFAGSNFGHAEVNFRRTRFGDGKINFQYVEFGTGNISFQFSNFGNGDVSFINTDFSHGNVDFKAVTFGDGETDFRYAKFRTGDVSFEKAVFGKGKKDFKMVEFGGGKIDFKRVYFGDGDVLFEFVEFGNGKVTFRQAEFGDGLKSFEMSDFGTGSASFEKVTFGRGKISFNNAKIGEVTFQGCHFDDYLDLRFARCESIDLTDTIVRDIIDFKAQEYSVQIKRLKLMGMRNLGRIYISWHNNRVKELIYGQKDTTIRQKAGQFRILKEDFSNTGRYSDEDKAYVEFKRCEALADLEAQLAANPLNAFWAYPFYVFKWLVFDRMGLYATAPIRVLTSMVVVYTFYSLLYVLIPYLYDVSINTSLAPTVSVLAPVAKAFYFSAVTFLTIGYGDYYPTGILRVIAPIEGFTGLFMMSYFTVAFVRKILR